MSGPHPINITPNNNEVVFNNVNNHITITNNVDHNVVEIIQPVTTVIEINTGIVGPQGSSVVATSGSFTGCVIFGVGATASGNNQFVVGSGSDTVGVVNTETVTSTRTWSVYINGAAHKILLA